MKPQEPVAQKADADEPVVGSVREKAHNAQAAAENTPSPPEAPPAANMPEEPAAPSRPLPDLRQGIPSTFDFEFGAVKRGQQPPPPSQPSSSATADDKHDLDITYTHPSEAVEPRQRGEREDRQHDRAAYETSLDRRRNLFANYLYFGLLITLTSWTLYLARPFGDREEVPTSLPDADASGWTPSKLYARIRARLGKSLGYYTEPTFPKLLPDVPESQRPPFTLVLSLEDLLIYSTWDRKHGYRTAKRPGLDYFIRYLLPYYELVLFTSTPLAIADPVIKKLDPYHFIQWPLGREATKYEADGEYVKDLSYLNRDLSKVIVIDTRAEHVRNQKENAIVLPPWKGDPKGPETADLVTLIPFLEYVATMGIEDVRPVLKSFEKEGGGAANIPQEFARREALAKERFLAQHEASKSRAPRLSLGSLASGLGVKAQPGAGGGMVLADGTSVAEGLAKGKMLSELIREQGVKQYEALEQQIREHGAQWLREEEEEQKKMMEVQMKEMKKNAMGGWFGGRKE